METETTRICKHCGKEKPITEFYKQKKYRSHKCRDCWNLKLDKPRIKDYQFYLRQAGMLGYYERSMRNRNDTMRKYH